MEVRKIKVKHKLLDYKSCIYESIFSEQKEFNKKKYNAVQIYAVESEEDRSCSQYTDIFTLVRLNKSLFGYKISGNPYSKIVIRDTRLPRKREERLIWSANTSDTFHVFEFFKDVIGEEGAKEARDNYFKLLDNKELKRFKKDYNNKDLEIWKI